MNSASSSVRRRSTSLSVSRTRMAPPLGSAQLNCSGTMLQAFQNAQQFSGGMGPGELPGTDLARSDVGGAQLFVVEQALDAGSDRIHRLRIDQQRSIARDL